MRSVTFSQLDRSIEVPRGTTVLEAARRAGIVIESPCNSAGVCGKCLVQLDATSIGNVVQKGMHRLSEAEASLGFVLSCEAEITGDVYVARIPRADHRSLQITGAGIGCRVDLDPFITKEHDAVCDVTTVWGGTAELALETGDTTGTIYGVVVDIGTTTLSASLVDLRTGAELACAGGLNPQSHHAQDVLSRIRFAATAEGLQTMHLAVLGEIGRLIALLAAEAGVHHRHIHEIVFSGNTCMLHLSLAEDPASLGKFPYHFQLSGNEHRPASAFRLPAAHHALIYLPPVISAFVGPDITSGILATALHRRQGATLLVDIGTNGEMVLARDGALFATSTAAGPAFEGMNIGCGMRATNGAIEAFEVDELGRCDVKTIGGVEATGICGSGLMDIVAQLVTCGVITPSGRFCAAESAAAPGLLRDRLERRDGKVSFRVTERVTLSQKDIRQVQLAKGAIRAGIEFLLKAVGVDAASVERVLIAGSFGYHLRAESLLALGLLPGAFGGRIEFVGNTSKSGGAGFLLSRSARDEMASVVAGVEVVELASFADFDRCFVDCLSFPERTCTSA